MLQRLRSYAEQLALINLDEADEVYQTAYLLFERGTLDSLNTYLEEHIDFEEKLCSIRRQEAQG